MVKGRGVVFFTACTRAGLSFSFYFSVPHQILLPPPPHHSITRPLPTCLLTRLTTSRPVLGMALDIAEIDTNTQDFRSVCELIVVKFSTIVVQTEPHIHVYQSSLTVLRCKVQLYGDSALKQTDQVFTRNQWPLRSECTHSTTCRQEPSNLHILIVSKILLIFQRDPQ